MVAIEVAARHEDKFALKQSLLLQECMQLAKCLLNYHTAVDLFLGNTCKFCTKVSQLRVEDWLDIGLED